MKQDEERVSTGGFTFVTVAPKQNDNATMRRLRAMQDIEKAGYRGADTQYVGRAGNGLQNPRVPSAHLETFEKNCRLALEEFQQEEDFRPPLIHFTQVNEGQLVKGGPPQNSYSKGNYLHQSDLLYRVFKTDARLVRSVLENVGFAHTDSHNWNLMWLGTNAQQYLYEGLNEYQRINHFPSSHEITRKDRLSMNILRMQQTYGDDAYDFVPQTFVLPDEFADFYATFHEQRRSRWIVKPAASSQGRGIYLIDSINEVPMNEKCIISKYIQNPLLINGLKFDLRIYVLITSFEPLKIYVYDEGLARFASEVYTPDARKNKYAHLTNYSVNKRNEKFVQNADYTQDDVGHKWSLSALFRYLDSAGVDIDFVWNKIYDLVIKTILAIEQIVVEASKKTSVHRNNCFDLFGFDVLLDSNLKPWLLEVNLSPSLAADSPLDLHIKGNLIADSMNLIGLRLYDRKRENSNKVKARLRARQNQISGLSVAAQRRQQASSVMREVLRDALEEYERRGHFLRVYPSYGSNHYDQFFSTLRPLNRSLYKALYSDILNRDPSSRPEPKPFPQKLVKLPSANTTIDSEDTPKPLESERLVITGDDILMEYVNRLCKALRSVQSLRTGWRRRIEKFVEHYVWHNPDHPALPLAERLEHRVNEMKERQRRLHKPIPKRVEEQKLGVIKSFQASQLESMLAGSSKNLAQEVVSCLIDSEAQGVLSDILKWLAGSAPQQAKRDLSPLIK